MCGHFSQRYEEDNTGSKSEGPFATPDLFTGAGNFLLVVFVTHPRPETLD